MRIEQRLEELGIELPKATAPAANYVNAVLTGNLLFLSGKGPYRPDGTLHTGIVGQDVTVEEAYQHARLTGLHLISTMQAELGDLDRVVRIVKVLGMVNAVPGFGAAARDHQRLLRPVRRGVRRQGPPCPLGGRHGQPAAQHHGRDRGDGRGELRFSATRRWPRARPDRESTTAAAPNSRAGTAV